MFNKKWGDSLVIESGRLVVSEFHKDTSSNHIEVYFNRIKTKASNPKSPIVFLAGGPGSSATQVGRTKYFYLFKELSKEADIILIDQRETGQSIPNLVCRNSLNSPTDITENVQKYIFKDLIKKSKACAEEFTDMNIQLQAYNSYESALDMEAIRKKLGYEKLNLYGYSYGTELAPDHGVKLPFEVQNQFEKIDSLISLDKRLSKYIPDFTSLIKQTHQDLQVTSKFVQIPMQDTFDDDGAEKTIGNVVAYFRSSWDMTLTDDHLQMMVGDNIGKDDWIAKFPSYYYKIANDSLREVGNQLRNFRRRRLPNALFFTANVHSGYTNARWLKALEQDKTSYISHFGISYGRYPEIYKAFGVDKVEGMNQPVFSDLKTLFINGTLDGRTPINLRDTIATRFPNHLKITLENRGHNELLNNEIKDAIVLFLNDSLQNNVTLYHDLEFDNPVPYTYDITSIMLQGLEQTSASEVVKQYEKLYQEFRRVEDYVYEFKSHIFYNIASDLMDEQENDDAITLLEYAITKYPTDYLLYDYLALAYANKGEIDKAKATSIKALELNNFDGNAHVMLKKLK